MTKNVANNVAQSNSQDLTQAWKNGELEEGAYYVKLESGKIDIYFMLYDDDCDEIVEVLAPVPSYGDCLINETLIKDLSKKVNKLIEENAKLKELLKECQYMILAYSINHDTFTKEKVSDVVTKIDEALK